MTTGWSEALKMGNPVRSRTASQYTAYSRGEQKQAGNQGYHNRQASTGVTFQTAFGDSGTAPYNRLINARHISERRRAIHIFFSNHKTR